MIVHNVLGQPGVVLALLRWVCKLCSASFTVMSLLSCHFMWVSSLCHAGYFSSRMWSSVGFSHYFHPFCPVLFVYYLFPSCYICFSSIFLLIFFSFYFLFSFPLLCSYSLYISHQVIYALGWPRARSRLSCQTITWTTLIVYKSGLLNYIRLTYYM